MAMNLLRAATVSVANLDQAITNYCEWLDYSIEERGELDADLASSWGTPGAAGRPFAVLRPASGRDVFLRFVENRIHPDYVPLRTYGWAAIEICVQDVLEANERMLQSPFEIIGPPREIDGLPAIYPMQLKGPDGEIVYLTQIRDDLPAFDLPRAEALIDRLFILVIGCSDMNASLDWFAEHAGLEVGRRKMEIVYTMLANAFGLPVDDLHVISTMVHGRDVFLEMDQYPAQATSRPGFENELPQGVAVGTLLHPDFEALVDKNRDLWLSPPAIRNSCIYGGKPSATLRAPDGTLVEIVAA
jgi:catechol 2,3-dioxygenase-like lactoylglutathione lyase family enzyme